MRCSNPRRIDMRLPTGSCLFDIQMRWLRRYTYLLLRNHNVQGISFPSQFMKLRTQQMRWPTIVDSCVVQMAIITKARNNEKNIHLIELWLNWINTSNFFTPLDYHLCSAPLAALQLFWMCLIQHQIWTKPHTIGIRVLFPLQYISSFFSSLLSNYSTTTITTSSSSS